MSISNVIRQSIEEALEVQRAVLDSLLPQIESAALLLTRAFGSGGTVFLAGNGGSAADAQHIAAEFVGRFLREREPLPAIALHCDSSSLTAIANDCGFEEVFARPLRALGRPGDVLIALSTSGKSKNVIAAARVARSIGMHSIALTGSDGGDLGRLVDVLLAVPSTRTPRVQEAHIVIGHALCDVVERELQSIALPSAGRAGVPAS